MQESAEKIIDLILKSLRDEISDPERRELDKWLAESPAYRQVFQELTNEHNLKTKLQLFGQVDTEAWWKKINEKIDVPEEQAEEPEIQSVGRRWWKYAVAAAIIVLVGLGVYYYFLPKEKAIIVNVPEMKEAPVLPVGVPGGNYAILSVNGKKYGLKNAPNGILFEVGNTRVVKVGDGQLAFENIGILATGPDNNNFILTTPKGSQYSLRLPDSSMVWLNAASSVSYKGGSTKERRVDVTGEVLFDVRHDGQPFYVSVLKKGKAAGEIEVMGTKFNINAYPEEKTIKTTLIKGKVIIKPVGSGNDGNSKELAPGQQAVMSSNGSPGKIDIEDVDVDRVGNWTQGLIGFDNTPFDEVMRLIGRWYNVEIVYEKEIYKEPSSGTILGTESLSSALSKLSLMTGLKMKQEGGKVVVVGK